MELNKNLEGDIDGLRKEFALSMPYKHILFEDLLEKDFDELLNEVKKLDFEMKECDLFSLKQSKDLENFKDGKIREFYELFSSLEFGKFLKEVTGKKLKFGKIDMAATLYEECDYLLCHDDRLEGRKLAYVYYLNDMNDEEGGSFILFDNREGKVGKAVKRIQPRKNALLVFEVSEKSFHEVSEVLKGKRYAIGGWFH